jgi:hypothetical protein
MSNASWDKEEIRKLAAASGKPLEVRCAEVFLQEGWDVRLGTFYTDVASEKIRELDFLAERMIPIQTINQNQDGIDYTLRFRILGSCKGFPAGRGPVAYSVFSSHTAVEKPCLICYECGLNGRSFALSMSLQSAWVLLQKAKLLNSQQIVGFDIFDREELAQRPKNPSQPPQVKYSRVGDRDLYEGLDTAIKAAIFWYREDRRLKRLQIGGANHCSITLNIPLLVCSLPFWSVSIDGGKAGAPELRSSGFHVGLYPSGDSERPPEPITSIIWEIEKLAELTRHLSQLIEYVLDEAQDALKKC